MPLGAIVRQVSPEAVKATSKLKLRKAALTLVSKIMQMLRNMN